MKSSLTLSDHMPYLRPRQMRLLQRLAVFVCILLLLSIYLDSRSTRSKSTPVQSHQEPIPENGQKQPNALPENVPQQALDTDTNGQESKNTFIHTPLLEKHKAFLKMVENANRKARDAPKPFKTSYQCLGKQNTFDSNDGRSCMFKNLCYDKTNEEFVYFQPYEEPVFYDHLLGPLMSFKEENKPLIKVNALPWTQLSFAPVVRQGEPPSGDKETREDIHVFWAHWSYEYNMGHFVYEELASAYFSMKRFGVFDKTAQLVNLRDEFSHERYTKFVDGFAPAISSVPVIHFKSFLDSVKSRYVCFKKAIVAAGTRNFLRSSDEYNEGRETLWFNFRKDVLESHGLDPTFVPETHRIFIIKKGKSQHSFQKGRTHFRDIYNVEEVHKHLTTRYPHIPVEVLDPNGLSIQQQLEMMTKTTILITPPGGVSMIIPFLPVGSHAIIMDHYGTTTPWVHTVPGESVSMEVSFWNTWPHVKKQYYQIMDPKTDIVADIPGSTEYREEYSVRVNLARIEYMVNNALDDIDLK